MVFLEILASANYAGFRSDSHICDISRNTEATVVPLYSILATPDILYNWNSLLASTL